MFRRRAGQARRLNGLDVRDVLLAVTILSLCTPALAQDTVLVASGSEGGRTRITGRILDYTGRELTLEHAGGQQRRIPAELVLNVETPYGQKHTEADALFAAGHFDQALPQYLEARELEDTPQRRWVRRQIIARIVRCYAALGRPDQAGEAFLLLVRADPAMLHFDCIPLAWMPRQPSPAMEQTARRWLQRNEPAAALLGASHLLAGNARAGALSTLRQLSTSTDRRVALLASAQTWRAELTTADDDRLDTWAQVIEQLPEPLTAGPYFVLGRARAHRKQWDRAALASSRVAILHPQQRPLAAQSLVDAGRCLEELGDLKGAVRLYRELARDYPEQRRAVAEAQSRIDALSEEPKED
ncbi:MAG: tetratricopeptide repeat protein [Candidatus Nealsonbacteria bacterium]|nr:tetratricopeptide repeat protein [Candidatus Nealsonbacteria bacterium]